MTSSLTLTIPKRRRRKTRPRPDVGNRELVYRQKPVAPCGLWHLHVIAHTVSESNQRDWKETNRRKHRHFQAIGHELLLCEHRPELPVRVVWVRIHPPRIRKRDGRDLNALDPGAVGNSFKHLEDELCRWLGCDDGDATAYEPVYRQRAGDSFAVEITIERKEMGG